MMTTSHGSKQANALLRPKIGAMLFTGMVVLLFSVPNAALADEPITVGSGQLLSDCEAGFDEAGEEAPLGESGDSGSASDNEEDVLSPEYDTCLTVAGACEVVTKARGSAGYIKTGWAVGAFFDAGFSAGRSKLTTTVTCEGTYLLTVAYSGGIGLYQGQSTVLMAQTIQGDHVDEQGTESKSCTYIGTLGECATAHQYEWGGKLTYSGEAPSTINMCIKAKIVVDDDLLKLPYLGTTGYANHCFDALNISFDGDAALGLVDDRA